MENLVLTNPIQDLEWSFLILVKLLRKWFKIFDDSEAIYGFNISNGSEFSRKIIDSYTDWVKRPQIGALGLIWVKHNEDGTVKSSIDKFFSEDELKKLTESNPGDLSFIISGRKIKL